MTKRKADLILELIESRMVWCGSHERLGELLHLLRRAGARTFWNALAEWWTLCDDTWPHRPELLRQLRRHGPGRNYLPARDRSFLDALPERVTIYRGCSRSRVRGVSWTTDPEIAAGFARGHRAIPVPDPVVVEAEVDRARILAAFTDRQEAEVLVDPLAIGGTLANPASGATITVGLSTGARP